MTHTTSEKLVDVALGVAVTGAAFYILKTPSLRRLAWRVAVIGLTRTLPAWFRREISDAWEQSGRSRSAADPAVSPRPA